MNDHLLVNNEHTMEKNAHLVQKLLLTVVTFLQFLLICRILRLQFVKVITGNEVLSAGLKIQVGKCWRGGGRFEIHTCFNSLDVPTDVPKEAFLEALDAILGEGYNIA